MNDAQRRALRGLSVFRGGCAAEAAFAIVDAPVGMLTSLAHESVLRWVVSPNGVGRYEMHELVRQFAAEQLAANRDERAAVEKRHADYYLRFVAEREHQLTRSQPRAAASEIRGELDNVRQGWAWASAQVNLAALERTAYSLGQFYMLSGLLKEGSQVLGAVVAAITDALPRAASDAPERQRYERVISTLLSFQSMGLNCPMQATADGWNWALVKTQAV